MTNQEAIQVLQDNVIFACEKADLSIGCKHSVYDALDKAIEALRAKCISEKGWISVKDRLPQNRQWVLCQCRAWIREVLRLQDGRWYHDSEHTYFISFVTHWMPLPEPPKEDD